MTLPHTEPQHNDLDRALNEELMKDLPHAKLKHERLPSAPGGEAPSGPPVDPKAGAGGGKWGPSSPTPPVSRQLDCIRNDTQRLIETLHDLQAGLTLIRDRLG